MSPSYNPPSPRMLRNITWNSEKPKEVRRLGIDAQEIFRIMNNAYLPRPPATDRALQESRAAAYVDAPGRLHDAESRPFPPIHKPSPPYSTLHYPGHRSGAACWETFETNRPRQVDAFNSEDDHCHYRSSVGPNTSAGTLFIQYEHPSFGGQKSYSRILATGGIQGKPVDGVHTRNKRRLREKEVGIKHEGGLSEGQRNLKP